MEEAPRNSLPARIFLDFQTLHADMATRGVRHGRQCDIHLPNHKRLCGVHEGTAYRRGQEDAPQDEDLGAGGNLRIKREG